MTPSGPSPRSGRVDDRVRRQGTGPATRWFRSPATAPVSFSFRLESTGRLLSTAAACPYHARSPTAHQTQHREHQRTDAHHREGVGSPPARPGHPRRSGVARAQWFLTRQDPTIGDTPTVDRANEPVLIDHRSHAPVSRDAQTLAHHRRDVALETQYDDVGDVMSHRIARPQERPASAIATHPCNCPPPSADTS